MPKRIHLIDTMPDAGNIGMNQTNTSPDSWSLAYGQHKSYTKITNVAGHSKLTDTPIQFEKKCIVKNVNWFALNKAE